MITITKIFHFEAAHFLPDHLGKCRGIHGHSYKLEVTVVGNIKRSGAENGMVMDFGKLKEIVQKYILSRVDHTCLNMTIDASYLPPTAENMCNYFALLLKQSVSFSVVHIRLWETADSHADWWNDDFFGGVKCI